MRPLATFAATAREPHQPDTVRELRLEPSEVDVWRATLDEQTPETLELLRPLLAADELDRASRFFFERDRERYVVGRGILRLLLARYLECAATDLVFTYGPNGKPGLATPGGGRPPIFFNVAHSEGLALYAFTRVGEVGIDVERIRDLPDWEQVAEAAFSPQELARLQACPPERRREEFFRAWTRQEAVLKALGTGLGASAVERGGAEQGFAVHPLHPGPGYAAALAADPAGRWTAGHTFKSFSQPFESFRGGKRIRLEGISSNGAKFL